MKQLFLTAILIMSAGIVSAQAPATPAKKSNIQPRMMAVPRVPNGVDMKAFYDSDVNVQIAIAKVGEAFLTRGARIADFDQALKQMYENEIIDKASNNAEDVKTMILQKSAADIYIEIQSQVVPHPGRGSGVKSVNLILNAYQTGTSNILATKVGKSNLSSSEDIGLLTSNAIESVAEEFLNMMQNSFTEIVDNGQSVFVQFTANNNSKMNLHSEINGETLEDTLNNWFAEHSVNGAYNPQGGTDLKVIYPDIRIPLRSPTNPNANYTAQNFSTEIMKYLKSIGVNVKKEIGTKNKIIFTIL
jgi:hypothetical protein